MDTLAISALLDSVRLTDETDAMAIERLVREERARCDARGKQTEKDAVSLAYLIVQRAIEKEEPTIGRAALAELWRSLEITRIEKARRVSFTETLSRAFFINGGKLSVEVGGVKLNIFRELRGHSVIYVLRRASDGLAPNLEEMHTKGLDDAVGSYLWSHEGGHKPWLADLPLQAE